MAVSAWFRPPRHLVILLLGITLALLGSLAWLGWRLMQQDRALARQRVQDRLESAADLVVAELRRRLAETEESLTRLAAAPERPDDVTSYAAQLSSDALLVVITPARVDGYPRERLLFYPTVSAIREPPPEEFAGGEALEFRERNYSAASEAFRNMARSEDSLVRAAALLRLGRTLRKAKRHTEALTVYAELARLGGIPVGGLPAELVARHARLIVLRELNEVGELRIESDSLYDDLCAGRWRINHGAFDFYLEDVSQWIDRHRFSDSSSHARRETNLVLSRGVEWLWNEWRFANRNPFAGERRAIVRIGDYPFFALWRGTTERTVGLIAGPVHLQQDWLADLTPMLARERVQLALADADGAGVVSQLTEKAPLKVTRATAETKLPWTLQVASADPVTEFAQLASRRYLVLFGIGSLTLLMAVGLYAVTRGVARELEVARLKSDFVAAVSHDFRTPLTSMRQLTELLASGRVASEQRRAQYYQVIKRESERLQRLVEGLLDFARMEANAREFRLKSTAATALVHAVVDDFQNEVADGGYRIVFNANDHNCRITADPDALSRAVWNLLDNAVKYSPECNTVWVDVEPNDQRLAIRITDRGLGIAPKEQRAIFKKFVRGTGAEARGQSGTGIGLAMVDHIVRAHGGEVRVESAPGAGSSFTILLPIEE